MNTSGKNPHTKHALCGICPAGCWVLVTYGSDGRIDKVEADPDSQLGMICKLGEHSRDIVYSEHRLKYPMRRKGKKGSVDFERISWEDAFNEIVENLERFKQESGPESTAIYTGRGSFERAMCDVYQPDGVAVSSASSVLFPFGSPNTLGVGALCYVSFAMIAPHVTMGGMLINMFSDIEHAELVVVWGANPATDTPPLDLNRIMQANRKGTEVIVIDPRRTRTARLTNARWIPVRPGTDGALALSMCHVIIEEELYDAAFVENWTLGFDEFTRYVQHFHPGAVETITGVPADTITELARKIAGARGATPVMYTGLEYSDSGVQAIRATQVLWALAGQLDVPGGRNFSMRDSEFPFNRSGLIANPDPDNALGLDRFPVYSAYRGESHAIVLPESVLNGDPYRIRSLIILGGSIITAWPQPKVWRKTLNALDFLVCIDRQLTADAAYADIVLPATTMYEIESYMIYGPIFRIREPVIPPVGESRNDFFILAELAKRLGYGDLYPQSEEELLRYILKGSGFTLEQVRKAGGTVQINTPMMQYRKWEKGLLRKDGKPGFETPSGKFEIASTILGEHGYDSLPEYTEPGEGPLSRPDLAKKYPLIFNSGARVTTDFRSQHHGIPALSRERPEPAVSINPRDAERRSIKPGDRVIVKTRRGSVKMRAFVTGDIMEGTVDANMGGGGPVGPKAWQECNINDLTDLNRFDPISGFPVYKTLLCQVEKAGDDSSPVVMDSGEYDEEDVVLGGDSGDETAQDRVYLDNNATTPLDPEVRDFMVRFMEAGDGNPSGITREGKDMRFAVESARRQLARLIGCTAKRLIFTGGGSEANNLAIKGIAFNYPKRNKHLITSAVEHPSVLNTFKWLQEQGYAVTFLEVDTGGRVLPETLKKAITEDTVLISIMTANNETGTVQPIAELSRIARRNGVPFHTDAVQAVGKIPVNIRKMGVDLLTLSGHKFYGPKGVGVLYRSRDVELSPIVHGGSQESGLRGGTENVLAIAALGKAAELAAKRLKSMDTVRKLRDELEKGILAIIPEARVNGQPGERLPNTVSMILPGMRGESVVLALDQKGVAIASGSACRAGSPDPSHALLAMGLTNEDAHCTVRISLGIYTTKQDVKRTLTALEQMVTESQATVRFIPCR